MSDKMQVNTGKEKERTGIFWGDDESNNEEVQHTHTYTSVECVCRRLKLFFFLLVVRHKLQRLFFRG